MRSDRATSCVCHDAIHAPCHVHRRPVLLANQAKEAKKRQGKWFEEREAAAQAAAAYRSLDPAKWYQVTRRMTCIRFLHAYMYMHIHKLHLSDPSACMCTAHTKRTRYEPHL